MGTVTRSTIDWDVITKNYGADTRLALERLLQENDVPEDGTAAVLIAGMFIAQTDNVLAFDKLADTLETGRSDLADQFRGQVEQLRGIISFAQEHLVETGEELVVKRQNDVMEAVKLGVSKAISRGNSSQERRTIASTIATLFSAAALTVTGFAIGGMITLQATRISADPFNNMQNGNIWRSVISGNQETLNTCLQNQAELGSQCAITLPATEK